MQKSFTEISRDLKNKIYYPLYILEGEEPYFNEQLVKHFEEDILNESEKGFNLNIVYGKDVSDTKIVALASGFPMFGNYNIVIVKEAQAIKDWSALSKAASGLPKSTILVLFLAGAALDKRKTEIKNMVTQAIYHHSKKLKDSEILDFATDFIKHSKHSIKPDNLQILSGHLSSDLSFVVNELNKLILNVPEGHDITAAHIQQFIGINKEYNVFALTKALGMKKVREAIAIADYFSKNTKENHIIPLLSQLHSYFYKILMYQTMSGIPRNELASAMGVNPYFLNEYESATHHYSNKRLYQIMDLLSEYDLRSKKIIENNADDGALLRELVLRILN